MRFTDLSTVGASQTTWNFADGSIIQTTDIFSVHHYRYPGLYKPLLVQLSNPGASFCAPKQLLFDPEISSVTGEVSPDQLSYHWNFGTGNAADTSHLKAPSFTCRSAGTYEVTLLVKSSAGGAVSYQWINQTTGLSNTNIANPRVKPDSTTTYTVVGTGEASCFTYTTDITVRGLPLPVINAGPDMELQPGSNFLIRATSSSDVVSWRWEPTDFLSCTTCPAPETRPQRPITYRITAATATGCVATDTVAFTVLCNDSRIYIPNAFIPNADGKNEGFKISADGVTQVNYIMVYNRLGQKVFERKNFQVNYQAAVWDGRYNGSAVPSGAYVYMIELQCMDQRFQRKGSVVVLYCAK